MQSSLSCFGHLLQATSPRVHECLSFCFSSNSLDWSTNSRREEIYGELGEGPCSVKLNWEHMVNAASQQGTHRLEKVAPQACDCLRASDCI